MEECRRIEEGFTWLLLASDAPLLTGVIEQSSLTLFSSIENEEGNCKATFY